MIKKKKLKKLGNCSARGEITKITNEHRKGMKYNSYDITFTLWYIKQHSPVSDGYIGYLAGGFGKLNLFFQIIPKHSTTIPDATIEKIHLQEKSEGRRQCK